MHAYTLPWVEESLMALGQANVFSTLDLLPSPGVGPGPGEDHLYHTPGTV